MSDSEKKEWEGKAKEAKEQYDKDYKEWLENGGEEAMAEVLQSSCATYKFINNKRLRVTRGLNENGKNFRNLLISVGLEPVLSYMKNFASLGLKKTGFILIIVHFYIRGKLLIILCDK